MQIQNTDLKEGDRFWYLGARHTAAEVRFQKHRTFKTMARVVVETVEGKELLLLAASSVTRIEPDDEEDEDESPTDRVILLFAPLLSGEVHNRLDKLEGGPISAAPLDKTLEELGLVDTFVRTELDRRDRKKKTNYAELSVLGWKLAKLVKESKS